MRRAGRGMRWRLTAISSVAAVTLLVPALGASAEATGIGTWTKLKPVPNQGGLGVEGMSVGVINGKIYAAFGYDARSLYGDTDIVRIYDPVADSWTVPAHQPRPPGGRRSEAGAAVVNGKLYVVGGGDRSAVKADVDVYDPSTGLWTALAPLPNVPPKDKPDKKSGLAVVASGGFLYAIGGRNSPDGPCSPKDTSGILSTVEKYNVANDTWTQASPLPLVQFGGHVQKTPGLSDMGAAVVNGKIWIFGGCTVQDSGKVRLSNQVSVYDPSTDTWTADVGEIGGLPDGVQGVAGFSQVAAIGTTVYIIGGYVGGDSKPLKVTLAYDTTTGQTTVLAPMLTRRAEMGVLAYNGEVYTIGGAKPAFGNDSSANEKFTP